MTKKWKITGYNGAKVLFEQLVPVSNFSESEMETLLQRLTARHLTEQEVVGASLRKNATGYRPDFEIRKNSGGRYGLMTNDSAWYYTALIEDE